jgi:hypothetical protein
MTRNATSCMQPSAYRRPNDANYLIVFPQSIAGSEAVAGTPAGAVDVLLTICTRYLRYVDRIKAADLSRPIFTGPACRSSSPASTWSEAAVS